MKKESLNEKPYRKISKRLITIYLVLTLLGIGMTIFGYIMLKKSSNNMIGYILLIVGLALFLVSANDLFRYIVARRKMISIAEEVLPASKSIVEESSKALGKTIGTAINEAQKEISKNDK